MDGLKDRCGEREGSGQKMADRGVGGRRRERWMANNGWMSEMGVFMQLLKTDTHVDREKLKYADKLLNLLHLLKLQLQESIIFLRYSTIS